MKPRYKTHLPRQQANCEANYQRLLRLLPDLHERNCWQYIVGNDNTDDNYVIIRIKERAKYTTTINLFQRCKSHHTYSNNAIVVRLYHDANLAEVLSCQHYRGFQARYQYPNRHMHQCDEKARLNSFLGELLTHYLLHGRVAKTILPNQTSEQLSISSGYLPQATTRLLMPSID